jgi:TetR/AcrR family transcriptional regulator, ethionamide resistance regulator
MTATSANAAKDRGERREEVRDGLLATVERLLASGESYAGISVERLTAEAGMSRTRFYLYFEDKGDLLHAWHARLFDEADAVFGEWWSLGRRITRAQLRQILERLVGLVRRHHTLLIAIQDTAAIDPRTRAFVDSLTERHIAAFTDYIATGRREGWIASELDPASTAAWLAWMEERGVLSLAAHRTGAELRRVVDSYTAIVWKTLYTAPTG